MIKRISKIVKEVGNDLLNLRKFEIKGEWEGTQFKAEADKIAHQKLVSSLKKINSSLPIISEEDSNSLVKERPAIYWLIDPIDGTASLAKGYFGFVTQVALMKDNEPIISAVYAPVLNSLYTAEKGKGAFLNEKRLSIKKKMTMETLIDNYPKPQGIANEIYQSFNLKSYVECGSISLKICKVADGTADLFVKNVVVRDWDIAPAQLIIEESGGCLVDLKGHAFLYSGAYEHDGLVASTSINICKEIVLWYHALNSEEGEA